MAETVEDWLRTVSGDERDLAAAVLAFVREALDEAEETVKWNQPCFVVGGSNCLYVSAQSGYVNLGFYEGAALDDPAGLLEGTGKAMRHVKVSDPAALADPGLEALVLAAAAHARD
jgi:hypothetical protein